ncbi:NAD-dependent epimerase/dehydratase [Candidatus Koribacter versatilis Ellin345]|uniref:GDP-L-fucose synthase n=1 Tax=Koribacter versatilis (strain Ellin345) TaxID=204669 RepID=Q1IJY7_KORVE|nr:GDP-L-fucose synthase [Candidatus Koribacter versatilis]ABF42813.1 NAD-dependent epimerase/dehydratase [Candidatus Koribacter versatilis Ellin345]
MSSAISKSSPIFVAGHRGLAGSAIVRRLQRAGYERLFLKTHSELDLSDEIEVRKFFDRYRPECVFLAAAKVGGILANRDYPADFFIQNARIQNNVISTSFQFGVKRMVFLGSSCIYPKLAPQPLKEEYLLTGPLEFTNRSYAVAKIAGIELCWALNRQHGTKFLAAMPTNLYGPGDNYDRNGSHVLPALIRKVHEAIEGRQETVTVWGSGEPRREFLYSDDMADACVFLMELAEETYDAFVSDPERPPLLNIGCGEDLTISALAHLVAKELGYEGEIVFDPSKPDGTPRKLLDVSRLFQMGWRPKMSLAAGIREAYADFKVRYSSIAAASR